MKQALENIRVLDLSRVLAGPACTQILGDLGADIIKIEKPGAGDDTRNWGPPYLQDQNGQDTSESAYYLSANRNKRSVTIDITTDEGQKIIHRLLAESDVLIENFKAGGLAKYGLDYESLKDKYPHLIYCSITGFGQNGPLATEPGYDFLAQAMSGLMAITGEPDGAPMKAGVALSDVMTGLYSAIGILAALHHRETSGQGQHIDLSLLDCTLAGMVNIAQYYLTSGEQAPRLGNAHSAIVPYQAFETADGHIIIAVGNNSQFQRFAKALGQPDWAQDKRFARNQDRVKNRDTLVPLIQDALKQKATYEWISTFHESSVPAGPVNDMAQVFGHPQIKARAMEIGLPHKAAGKDIKLVGSPLKLSATPVAYKKAPPVCGEHTDDVLESLLSYSADEIKSLKDKGVI